MLTFFVSFLLIGTHKEGGLNKFANLELIQLFLNTEPNAEDCGSKELIIYLKKHDVNMKNVNSKLVKQLIQNEQQFLETAQYFRSECVIVIESKTLVND